ncbi:MAG TPA: SdrD B-like domain-containing protein [Tepidisphaeraceae bacterium]|jgi:uncharacterized delta-60 repeat protein|nr:SdrD B-like domain-containing protein [Tepidisphaeraceae bacterium]
MLIRRSSRKSILRTCINALVESLETRTLLSGGTVDTTFGTQGSVATLFSGAHSYAYATAVLVQHDGDSIVVGSAGPANESGKPNQDFALVRYTSAGKLDPTYGTNGEVFTDFNGGDDIAVAAALQSDGKVVVAGISNYSGNDNDFVLARYTTTGALDTTFGANGRVITNLSSVGGAEATAMIIDSQGRILVLGTLGDPSNANRFTIARYLPSGALDTTFGKGGIAVMKAGPAINSASALAIQPDGKIVVAGGSADDNFYATRLTSTGALDTTFGTAGFTEVNFFNGSSAVAVDIVAGGKILLGGTGFYGGSSDSGAFDFSRLNSNGTLDTTFISNGIYAQSVGNGAIAHAMTVEPDGNILMVGAGVGDNSLYSILVSSAQGFLSNGVVHFNTVSNTATTIGQSAAFAVAVQNDGRILVAGEEGGGTITSPTEHFIVNRFLGDAPVSISGQVIDVAGAGSGLAGVKVYLDINNNGVYDPTDYYVTTSAHGYYTFSNLAAGTYVVREVVPSGFQITAPSGGSYSLTLAPGQSAANENFDDGSTLGSISGAVVNLATGINGTGLSGIKVYLDLNNDGKLDTGDKSVTTGSDGSYTFSNLAFGTYEVREVVPSGTQVNTPAGGAYTVTLSAGNTSAGENFNNLPGVSVLDTSYGTSGSVAVGFPPPHDYSSPATVLLQSDGKSIVVGTAGPVDQGFDDPEPGTSDFVLTRYTTAGALDPTYGTKGVVYTNFGGGDSSAKAAVIQPNGDVVVAGTEANGDLVLARYTTAGALDATFGNHGKVTTTLTFGSGSSNSFGPTLSMALDSSGRLVVSGINGDVTVARFLSNGSFDASFGKAGVAKFTSGPLLTVVTVVDYFPNLSSTAIESDGKIVIAGQTAAGDMFAARLTSAGALDTTFGSAGVADINFPGETSGATAVDFTTGGKILLGGFVTNAQSINSFALVRLNTNGSLDTTFGTNGKTISTFPSQSGEANAMAVESNGDIILAGSGVDQGIFLSSALLARYTTAGVLDKTFNGNGEVVFNSIVSSSFAAMVDANAVIVQSNGDILVVGDSGGGHAGGDFDEILLTRFLG